MEKNKILENLKEIIVDIKGDIEIDEDTALIEKGILDSLELINYLTQIEEYFGIEISLEELIEKKLGLISNMIEYLDNKI
jgi:acyl carrier protein